MIKDIVFQVLVYIALAVFSAAVAALTVKLRKYLDKRGLAEEFGWVVQVVDQIVQGVEQMSIVKKWTSQEKLDHALAEASDKTGVAKAELKSLVEAAVNRLSSAAVAIIEPPEEAQKPPAQ